MARLADALLGTTSRPPSTVVSSKKSVVSPAHEIIDHSRVDQHVSAEMKLKDGGEFLCGWGAASINILITFPLHKLIFRQQLGGLDTRSAVRQLQREGFLQLYRGILPPLIQKSTSISIMFGAYDEFSRVFKHQIPSAPLVPVMVVSAMMAGCTEALMTPLERVQVLLQDRFYRSKYKNTLHAFVELRHHGFREYYRGCTAILMRNGPSNVLFFLFRNDIKRLMPKSEGRYMDVAQNFVSGGVLGACLSTMFFPVNVVKTRMQCRVGGHFVSFSTTLRIIWEERNRSVRALFRGVHVNYTRALISWGIINAMYELLKKVLFPEGADSIF